MGSRDEREEHGCLVQPQFFMQREVDPTIQKRFSAWGLTERVAFARDSLLVGFNFGGGVFFGGTHAVIDSFVV